MAVIKEISEVGNNGDAGSSSSQANPGSEKRSYQAYGDTNNKWANVDEPERESDKWYIHRVPSNLKDGHKERFEPVVVSIGPYHREPTNLTREDAKNQMQQNDADGRKKQKVPEKEEEEKDAGSRKKPEDSKIRNNNNDCDSRKELKVTENQKKKYMHDLLSRITAADKTAGNITADKVRNDRLTRVMNKIKGLEAKARECYSEPIELEGDDFVKIMILDGCFILELFYKFMENEVGELKDTGKDEIFGNKWMVPSISRDLVLLENQIPFMVLQELFEITSADTPEHVPVLHTQDSAHPKLPLLFDLITTFFSPILPGDDDKPIVSTEKGKHLLDILRNHLVDQPGADSAHPKPPPRFFKPIPPTDDDKPIVSTEKGNHLVDQPGADSAYPKPPPRFIKPIPPTDDDKPIVSTEKGNHLVDQPGADSAHPKPPPRFPLFNLKTFSKPIPPTADDKPIVSTEKGNHLVDQPGADSAHPKPPPRFSLFNHRITFFKPIPPTDDDKPIISTENGKRNIFDDQPGANETAVDIRDAPSGSASEGDIGDSSSWVHTVSATELQKFGVEFEKKGDSRTLLDISFSGGYFRMPPFHFGRYWSVLISNMIALEQCRSDYPDRVTSYACLLDNLVNSSEDVKVLRDSKIITGSNHEDEMIAYIINSMCKLAIYETFFLDDVCEKVNKYCEGLYRKSRAVLYQNFFLIPWKGPSIIAGIVVVAAALTQTIHDFTSK